jgi:lipid-A-disaccharide synthase
MAAGMGIKFENIDRFREAFEKSVCFLNKNFIFIPRIKIDGELPNTFIIDFDFLEEIKKLAPYGNGFEYPIFKIKGIINEMKIVGKNKASISIFAGSRISEITILTPILLNFIKLMDNKYKDIIYIFHSTREHNKLIQFHIKNSGLSNCQVISDDKIKSHLLKKSIFAVAKSGTVSLEICNAKIPSIILYKINFINFLIIKMLVKTKFANIINIAAKKEIIPELLQSKCNANNIYKHVDEFLENPNKIEDQLIKTENILNNFKTKNSSSELASLSLNNFLY